MSFNIRSIVIFFFFIAKAFQERRLFDYEPYELVALFR